MLNIFCYIHKVKSHISIQSSDESFDYFNDKFITPREQQQPPSASTVQSSTSNISIILNDNDDNIASTAASNEHKVLVDTICNISDAVEHGNCNIRESASIASHLESQHEARQLETVDYERLKRFIDKATERGLIFNDLNALYNYFIAESCRERFERIEIEKSSSATSSNKKEKNSLRDMGGEGNGLQETDVIGDVSTSTDAVVNEDVG